MRDSEVLAKGFLRLRRRGRVYKDPGGPVDGASVWLRDPVSQKLLFATTSDEEGYFQAPEGSDRCLLTIVFGAVRVDIEPVAVFLP